MGTTSRDALWFLRSITEYCDDPDCEEIATHWLVCKRAYGDRLGHEIASDEGAFCVVHGTARRDRLNDEARECVAQRNES